MGNNIHEQVKMQLEALRYWVDAEEKNKERCKKWNIPYIPSNRAWINIDNYNLYKEEINKNGDKNLIVMVKMNGERELICMEHSLLQDDIKVVNI